VAAILLKSKTPVQRTFPANFRWGEAVLDCSDSVEGVPPKKLRQRVKRFAWLGHYSMWSELTGETGPWLRLAPNQWSSDESKSRGKEPCHFWGKGRGASGDWSRDGHGSIAFREFQLGLRIFEELDSAPTAIALYDFSYRNGAKISSLQKSRSRT